MSNSRSSFAVIGLGFGDEGKGVTVNSLASQLASTLVVRYSGGQQAGHTVTLSNGRSHIFSNFGSGTMQSAHTYWSKYCTFDPVGFINEWTVLAKKGFQPQIFVDKNCPVTTPYDKFHNQNSNANLGHGTCGAGVGATYRREEKLFSLLVGDLLHPVVFKLKLEMIKKHYGTNPAMTDFLRACEIITTMNFLIVDGMPSWYQNVIFESSQGLMLDQNFGLFPHVTPSSVGTKNILEMGFDPHVFLVTRAYQTRHGNGPMTNLDIEHNIKVNPTETNVLNDFQGEFKRAILDIDLLKYVISRDVHLNKYSTKKELVVTCLDHVKDEWRYTVGGTVVSHASEELFVAGIANNLGISKVHAISSPDGIVRLSSEWAA